MALKILTETVDGERRVNPETMKLLSAFAEHKKSCQRCVAAMVSGSGQYCDTGSALMVVLAARPDVSFEPEDHSDN